MEKLGGDGRTAFDVLRPSTTSKGKKGLKNCYKQFFIMDSAIVYALTSCFHWILIFWINSSHAPTTSHAHQLNFSLSPDAFLDKLKS